MSINVTVSGNPVRINRGRMVTSDPKVEIQKRRRMRLEQVRSQSKDIAENIRNKVRKEKSRQETQFEKDSSSKLKEWQNKKLLQLQDQYVESVKEIGMGHSQALIEEADEQEFIEERSNIINITAKARGDVAYEKQKLQNNEKSLKATVPKQTKKMVRDVENAHAAMVSKMSKSGGKSAVHSQTEDDVTDFIVDVSPSSSTSARSRSPIKSPKKIIPKSSSPTKKIIPTPSSPPKNIISKSSSSNKSNNRPITSVSQDSSSDSLIVQNVAVPPADTRISDRIKHRHNFENQYVSGVIERPYSPDKSKKRVSNKENINRSPEASTAKIRKEENACTCNCQVHRTVPVVQSCKCATTCQEIPSKPTMSIRVQNDQSSNNREFNKVQYYDHDNRFSKDCIMDNSNVHKISEESIEMCPSDRSESMFEEVVSRREQEAAERGKRAFEKERIQRDMDNLMKKLPVLQKQERIAQLDPTKDKYHMNDDRLKEFEQSRQRKIESAFEKLVPNTITISPKNRNKSVRRPTAQEESPSTINVGIDSNYDEDKTSDELKTLLQKLKYQQDMLLQETDELPANSNLTNLLSKLVAKGSKHRKSSSSSSSSDSPKKKRHKSKDKPHKKIQAGTRKNKRPNKNILVLQNMSTQTSPKVGTRNSPKIPPVQPMTVSKSIDEVDADKVCEIVIKIQDNSKPEISVSSPKKGVQIGVEGPTDDEAQIEQEIAKVSIADTTKSKRKKEIDLKIRRTSDSWKQTLTKDTSNSSTSYYSPPEFTRQNSLLNKQPQQSNISATRANKAIDPKLMNYIKKLLQMSKTGVDDLGVSTVSDVSTPGSSVVNVEANNPAQKLITLLKMFNLNLEDVAENISQSGNDSRGYSTADVGRVSKLEGTNNGSTSKRGSRVSNNGMESNRVSNVNGSHASHDASKMQRSLSTDNANRNNSSRVPYNTSNRTVQDVSRASNNIRNNSSRASAVQNNASNRMTLEDVSGASNNIGKFSRRASTVQNNASNRRTLEDVSGASNNIGNYSRRASTVQNSISNRMTLEDVSGVTNNIGNISRRASTVQNNASNRMTLEDVNDAFTNVGNNSRRTSTVQNNASNRMPLEDMSRASNNFSRSQYNSILSAPGPSSYQDSYHASRQEGFFIEPAIGMIGNETRDSGGASGYEANQNQTVNSINQSTVSNRLTNSNISGDVRNVTLDEYADANYPDVIAHKYSQLANMCQQRIQNLAEMIEQVRSEKQQILSPGSTSSDKAANLTGYMGLPPSDGINSPNTEAIQRELTKQLTTVDIQNFANNSQLVNKITDLLSRSNEDNSVDPDLLERYNKLIGLPEDNPVYLDIPKLPKLQSQQVEQQNGKKGPPPLQRKYNDKVQLKPHELSTIAEADSIRRSKSPEAHRTQHNSPPKEIVDELIRASRISPNKSKSSPKNQSETNNSRGRSTSQTQQPPPSSYPQTQLPQSSNQQEPQPGPSAPRTCSPKQLQQIIQTLQDISTDTSTDKSEIDVEAMLINMGMGWAVATLRKTKQTLERHSSSSSISIPNLGETCNEKNITSSTSKSNVSGSPFFKDFADISAISTCGKQRTSTPLQQLSTSTDRSKSPPVQQPNTGSNRSRSQPVQQTNTSTERSSSQQVQQPNTNTDRSRLQTGQQSNTSTDRSRTQPVQQTNTSTDRSKSQPVQQSNTSCGRSRSQPVQQTNTSTDRSRSQPMRQSNTSNDRSRTCADQQSITSNDRSRLQTGEQPNANADRSKTQTDQQFNTSTDKSKSSVQNIMEENDNVEFVSVGNDDMDSDDSN